MRGIEISFPVDVEVPDSFYCALNELVGIVCNEYEKMHPDRVMWPFGQGFKITYMPMTKAEEDAGKHIEFDEDIYAIEVSERENYDFKCTKCGIPQGDHKHCITQPPAGDCEFSATQ
jgi:hypothetical protein